MPGTAGGRSLPDSGPVLDQLRARLSGTNSIRSKPPWKPPEISDFAPSLKVLAFDPSLSNLAWVVLTVHVRDGVRIIDKGTIRPPKFPEHTGFQEIWRKADYASTAL